jgi:hypothetical protein
MISRRYYISQLENKKLKKEEKIILRFKKV